MYNNGINQKPDYNKNGPYMITLVHINGIVRLKMYQTNKDISIIWLEYHLRWSSFHHPCGNHIIWTYFGGKCHKWIHLTLGILHISFFVWKWIMEYLPIYLFKIKPHNTLYHLKRLAKITTKKYDMGYDLYKRIL